MSSNRRDRRQISSLVVHGHWDFFRMIRSTIATMTFFGTNQIETTASEFSIRWIKEEGRSTGVEGGFFQIFSGNCCCLGSFAQ